MKKSLRRTAIRAAIALATFCLSAGTASAYVSPEQAFFGDFNTGYTPPRTRDTAESQVADQQARSAVRRAQDQQGMESNLPPPILPDPPPDEAQLHGAAGADPGINFFDDQAQYQRRQERLNNGGGGPTIIIEGGGVVRDARTGAILHSAAPYTVGSGLGTIVVVVLMIASAIGLLAYVVLEQKKMTGPLKDFR